MLFDIRYNTSRAEMTIEIFLDRDETREHERTIELIRELEDAGCWRNTTIELYAIEEDNEISLIAVG